MVASNAGGVGRNRDYESISGHGLLYKWCYYIGVHDLALMPAVNAARGQALSTRWPVDHGHRPVSCDTSLVVSGGVDCRRRRRNVYDKKPQHYAKDNRTAHLTKRSDKSVAYVTIKDFTRRFVPLKSQLLRDTKHHAASLRHRSYLLLVTNERIYNM